MQPKISSEFAITIVVATSGFFAWMIWLTASVIDLETRLVDTNYAQYGLENPRNKDKACPQDATLCPDGKTSVKRTGSKCEFAPCISDVIKKK